MSSVHPPQKNDANILDFMSFIKKYFDWFEIDGFNQLVISNLGLWATRNQKFNGKEIGWHIDRGILLWGNPGVGKDELFRILNQYLIYLRSPYVFDHRIVWQFATLFTEKERGGYHCFAGEGKQNRQYEELAHLDPLTGLPSRETVQHMGNKVLIGNELIHITYNAFKNYGYQSHFSTNEQEEKLAAIYGEKSFSRLKYMCNFIKIVGRDRRKTTDPVFLRNTNQPPIPPGPRELSPEEAESNKQGLEEHYQDFIAGRMPQTSLALVYNSLIAYGVKVATEEELRDLMGVCEEGYIPEQSGKERKNASERQRDKNIKVWEESRKMAVVKFFHRMQQGGAKSIFKVRDVEIPGINFER